ncbi:MAG: hypothetical protein QOC81_691 [Thermoanaerobaculia bacterium]|jgi:hypothetical protein|nr:hypothetical protein [Thermoanaerobaculia bacterium]
MTRRTIVLVSIVLFLWSAADAIAAFHAGDIIVSSIDIGDPLIFWKSSIRQYGPDGTLIQELYNMDFASPTDLKFSPSGILHVAGGSVVYRFASDGSMLTPLTAPPTRIMKTLAFDHSGNLFATSGDGYFLKFNSQGSQQGVTSLGTSSSQWADLGNDQCTLYHFTNSIGQIGRFNVCSNTMLTPLQTPLTGSGVTLVALSDGTLLASTVQRGMYRIQQDGTVLRHYATSGIAYARDLSPNFIWINSGPGIAKFDLQNDAIVVGPFDPGTGGISGIVIVGADPQAIPSLSPLFLALLALAVAISAILRLRS